MHRSYGDCARSGGWIRDSSRSGASEFQRVRSVVSWDKKGRGTKGVDFKKLERGSDESTAQRLRSRALPPAGSSMSPYAATGRARNTIKRNGPGIADPVRGPSLFELSSVRVKEKEPASGLTGRAQDSQDTAATWCLRKTSPEGVGTTFRVSGAVESVVEHASQSRLDPSGQRLAQLLGKPCGRRDFVFFFFFWGGEPELRGLKLRLFDPARLGLLLGTTVCVARMPARATEKPSSDDSLDDRFQRNCASRFERCRPP